jgi:hypothetical protein
VASLSLARVIATDEPFSFLADKHTEVSELRCTGAGPLGRWEESEVRRTSSGPSPSPRFPSKPAVSGTRFPLPPPASRNYIKNRLLRLSNPNAASLNLTTLQRSTTELSSIHVSINPREEEEGNGRSSEGFMDGGNERRGGGGPQGPGRTLPLELRASVHPPDDQGQRPQLLIAGQEAGAGDNREEAGGQGRGGVEERHVPQLLGT